MQQPTSLWEGNQRYIKLAQNEKLNPHTKHIHMSLSTCNTSQEKGILELQYCSLDEVKWIESGLE